MGTTRTFVVCLTNLLHIVNNSHLGEGGREREKGREEWRERGRGRRRGRERKSEREGRREGGTERSQTTLY